MIEFRDVCKTYETQKGEAATDALLHVNLSIADGELLAVMGPSGSGKSTMLHILGGMDRLTTGEYYFNDTPVHEMSQKQLGIFRRRQVSFIFQNFALMDHYTIYENIELPLVASGTVRRERKKRVLDCAEQLGIADLLERYPGQVSGGQQQRVAIARAIASEKPLILADEPTGALDQKNGRDLMKLLQKLNMEGKTIVVVTHDSSVAAYCQRTVYIQDGQLMEGGK